MGTKVVNVSFFFYIDIVSRWEIVVRPWQLNETNEQEHYISTGDMTQQLIASHYLGQNHGRSHRSDHLQACNSCFVLKDSPP